MLPTALHRLLMVLFPENMEACGRSFPWLYSVFVLFVYRCCSTVSYMATFWAMTHSQKGDPPDDFALHIFWRATFLGEMPRCLCDQHGSWTPSCPSLQRTLFSMIFINSMTMIQRIGKIVDSCIFWRHVENRVFVRLHGTRTWKLYETFRVCLSDVHYWNTIDSYWFLFQHSCNTETPISSVLGTLETAIGAKIKVAKTSIPGPKIPILQSTNSWIIAMDIHGSRIMTTIPHLFGIIWIIYVHLYTECIEIQLFLTKSSSFRFVSGIATKPIAIPSGVNLVLSCQRQGKTAGQATALKPLGIQPPSDPVSRDSQRVRGS